MDNKFAFLILRKNLMLERFVGTQCQVFWTPNKEEKQEDILPFNGQIRPQPFPCAQSPIHNSLNIIPFDVTIQVIDSVVKQTIKIS